MSDPPSDSSPVHEQGPYLWILFLTLFCALILIILFVVCHGTWSFCDRYCTCRKIGRFCWCCVMDRETYRRERSSLAQLRELRRLHREAVEAAWQQRQQQQLGVLRGEHDSAAEALAAAASHSQQHLAAAAASYSTTHHHQNYLPELATFSQIPGPIPNSQYAAHHANGRILYTSALGGGFVLVPANLSLRHHHHDDDLHARHALSPAHRRAILERLLTCKTYHAAANHDTSEEETRPDDDDDDDDDEEISVKEGGSDGEFTRDGAVSDDDRHQEESPTTLSSTAAPHQDSDERPNNDWSFAFPLHEVPQNLEQTCAICLDDFLENELINDNNTCPHIFHRTCLLEWLDRHDVCPCCRRTMITNDEWRLAAMEEGVHNNHTDARAASIPVHLVPAAMATQPPPAAASPEEMYMESIRRREEVEYEHEE